MYFRSFLRGVNRKQFSYSNKRTFFFNAASTQLVGSSTTPHIVPTLIPYVVALLLAATNNNENCDNMDHIVADPPLELYDVSVLFSEATRTFGMLTVSTRQRTQE